MMETKSELKFKAQFIQRLVDRGYTVTEDAKVAGKSGAEHIFDILAYRDDSFMTYTIAIGIAVRSSGEIDLGTLFNFDEQASDAGVYDKVFIAIPKLAQLSSDFARKQSIRVLDKEMLDSFLSSSPPIPITEDHEPVKFDTKDELSESLSRLGYRIEENVKIKGRSKVEHTFDMVAYSDDDLIVHRVCIDFVTGDRAIELDQILPLDTKAFDADIYNKVLVVSPGLSHEARQFTMQQQIKVFEIDKEKQPEPISSLSAATETDTQSGQKPAGIDSGQPESPQGEPETVDQAIMQLEHMVAQDNSGKTSHTKPKEEESLTRAPKLNLLSQALSPELFQLIPENLARKYNAIPLSLKDNTLQVAMANPGDVLAIEALAARSKKRIKPVSAAPVEIREAIDFNYKSFGDISKHLSSIAASETTSPDTLIAEAADSSPVARALNLIVEEAAKARASDIHIEPEVDRIRVRYRIDGTLHDMISLPISVHSALISRIKILGSMNIADHIRPQDGQFSLESKGRAIDIRVATINTVKGETAVLRLLDKSLAALALSQLGFLPESQECFEQVLMTPYGMLLISGPTGAGKTTTLYAAVNSLDRVSRNIITIEDPVEYHFSDINQIQVNTRAGLTFASGLRSIVRLDPDVILVGEIRDSETSQIAIQSALTGHLVLSSVHANDTVGVLFRLIDLDVEPFLICSGVIGIVAQRMVRRVCPHCARKVTAPVTEQIAYRREMNEERTEFLYGAGCEACVYTGYLGRTGIFEILTMTDKIKQMVVNRATSAEIRAQAIKDGMVSIGHDGMLKAKAGVTTPYEVMRNAYFVD